MQFDNKRSLVVTNIFVKSIDLKRIDLAMTLASEAKLY